LTTLPEACISSPVAATNPEKTMGFIRLILAPRAFVYGIFISGLLFGTVPAKAAGPFPFDRELLLDAAPMRPGKRMRMLTVAPDGKASIDLWRKSVTAQVELSDAGIKIEPGPLPDALPEMMGNGHAPRNGCRPTRTCSPYSLK
jgi:hypothetical protein